MAHTRNAPNPVRALAAIVFLLALATPPGRQIFIGATTWVGQVVGRMVVHSLEHNATATGGTPTGSAR